MIASGRAAPVAAGGHGGRGLLQAMTLGPAPDTGAARPAGTRSRQPGDRPAICAAFPPPAPAPSFFRPGASAIIAIMYSSSHQK